MENKAKIRGTIVGLNFTDNEIVIKLGEEHNIEGLQDLLHKDMKIDIFVQKI